MFKRIKAAYALFIKTAQDVATSVEKNTLGVEALAFRLANVSADSKALHEKLDVVIAHLELLATAKSKELVRQGHK
jgi:hypothetical protein